ncbi:MAG: oxygenase MpaB family protein [Sphingomonas sp.]
MPATARFPFAPLLRPLRGTIVGEVRQLLNGGKPPVARRPDGWFGPGSVTWRVHGDVAGMLVGGIAGLLLQMLHPAVLAGVWDHSRFRADMLGRLRNTARFIAITTYGGADEAAHAVAKVRSIHERVAGALPDGTAYAACDPALLAWVHVTETTSFLAGWRRYAEPGMSRADQDRYFAEMAQVAERLGADPVPRSRAGAEALIARMRPALRTDARTREVATVLLNQAADTRAQQPLRDLTMRAGVDLLPDWARRMHGLPVRSFATPLVRAGTLGLARTLRWAFA